MRLSFMPVRCTVNITTTPKNDHPASVPRRFVHLQQQQQQQSRLQHVSNRLQDCSCLGLAGAFQTNEDIAMLLLVLLFLPPFRGSKGGLSSYPGVPLVCLVEHSPQQHLSFAKPSRESEDHTPMAFDQAPRPSTKLQPAGPKASS